ncbi:MAG: esterase/lipase family protein [Chloroflexota bacterium]
MRNLWVIVLLVLLVAPVHAQTMTPLVEILDAQGQVVTQTVDGNRVRLRVTLTQPAASAIQAEFFLDGERISACVIARGDKACVTDPIETLGWAWATGGIPTPSRRIQAQAGNEAGGAVLQVSPRPVALVHGLISTASKFSPYLGYLAAAGIPGYAVGDGQFEGKLDMGNLTDPAAPTLTIAENAAQLGVYLEGVKNATGAEQVDLIAHSMGGLVSRYYIHQLMTEDDVAQLIMLGTPNGGSSCGGLLASLGFFLPASLELHPAYLDEIFNPQVTNARGVPFHAVAGAFITEPAFSPCSDVPSDSSVSQASVETIALQLAGLPPLEHNLLATDEQTFRGFVLPLLQTPRDNFAASPASQPAPAPKPGQFTQTFSGRLEKGASTSIPIEIDSGVNVASFGLYDSTRSLQISVQGASGKTLELDLENKGIVITEPETMLYLGYGFESPKPGKWMITLSTSERTPASGADYALYARFTGGARLNAQADELLPAIGQPVMFSADLDGGQIEAARVRILLPDGARKEIEFTASNDQFTAVFTPAQTGLHGVEIIVTGKTPEGFRVDRAASLVITAQPEAPSPIRTWAIYISILAIVVLLFGFILLRSTTPLARIVKRAR